jgi:hypothetical protein
LEYLGSLPDGYFGWTYVDTSHEYEHSKVELEALRTKVKQGGLVTGDDWPDDPDHIHYGLARAVKEFCGERMGDRFAFQLGAMGYSPRRSQHV